jgi:hypothetical protein
MNVGKSLFAQIMEFIPWTSFSQIIQRYCGDANDLKFRPLQGLPVHEGNSMNLRFMLEA